MRRLILVAIVALFCVAVWQESAEAIPAFARRYRLSCKTCHSPFPRLNAYGDEFAGNGFQLPDAEEPARSFADVGDDKLALLREFPMAARADFFSTYDSEDEAVETDFEFPYRLKALSGGAIYRDIAYYFYFYYDERGEVAGVDDAFLHFNNLFGHELDIILGQFAISDPLMKRELRLTYEDYVIYGRRIGDGAVTLNYDRGVMFTYSPVAGTDFVFELINGNGIPDADEKKNFDDDSFKNFFLRGSQEITDGVRLGGFYYFGRQTNHEITNRSRFWGIDGTLAWKENLTIEWLYTERRDDDAYFTSFDLDDIITKGAIVEAVYAPKASDSDWFLTFLYNWVDSDVDIYDYQSITFNFNYLLLRNMRLMGEFTRDIEFETNRFVGGIIFAL